MLTILAHDHLRISFFEFTIGLLEHNPIINCGASRCSGLIISFQIYLVPIVEFNVSFDL
jgi:hypothetical protein